MKLDDLCEGICKKYWILGEENPCLSCHPTKRALIARTAKEVSISDAKKVRGDCITELIVLDKDKNEVEIAIENLTWELINRIIETLEEGDFTEGQIKNLELILIEAKKKGLRRN